MARKPTSFAKLLAAVVDGQSVDWTKVEHAARSEADRTLLRKVKLLASIQDANRADFGDPVRLTVDEARDSARRPIRSYYDPAGVRSAWGKVDLFERLGEGAFGEVYRGVDRTFDREVAVKLFWPTVSSSESLHERVLREAKSLASVQHRNVAVVYYVSTNSNRLGMCMEFVRGNTLASLMQTLGRYSPHEASLVCLQVADALTAVHRAGLLHRDVKTQNVMRDARNGRIVLMDFGAAHAIERPTQTMGGTPLYVAPEVLRGEPATIQSDVYSLGVLLFKLVTDTYPYRGASVEAVREAQEEGIRLRASDERKDLPEAFGAILERALAADARDRFANAESFRSALKAFLSDSAGIPSEGNADAIGASASPSPVVRVFVSYAHDDAATINRIGLMQYLEDLESASCEVWSDLRLKTGDDWRRQIETRISTCHVLVPLVTQTFLRSRFCQDVEVQQFLRRKQEAGLMVFPVILSPCEWERHSWLKTRQFLPRKGTITSEFRRKADREQFFVGLLSELRLTTEAVGKQLSTPKA
jgi:serine/threonine protein kinase